MASEHEIENILITGGGDIGLLTALCIQKLNPGLEISVVDNFDESPPEVGKSTYHEMPNILHNFLDILTREFLLEVKPIWKGSVYFRDWCGYEPFHYPFDDLRKYPDTYTPDSIEHYYYHYTDVYSNPERRTVNEGMVEERKSPMYYDPSHGGYLPYETYAYHLDTNRFNSFLRQLCVERGVILKNDEVTEVVSDGNCIKSIEGAEKTYESDLYIDASGFNRVLKKELSDNFRNFSMPLDSAFNAKIKRELSDAVPATVIESGEGGWFWQIDTYNFRDVGYVFASEFISDERAADEFIEHCDGLISKDRMKRYGFTSGYFKTPWAGNCVTIGNAEGFVEPLQSTGLTASTQAALKLSNLLSSQGRMHHDGVKETYNVWVKRLWESIYDFISVHYKHSIGETQFWEHMQSLPVSSRVEKITDKFNACGYDSEIHPIENEGNITDLLVFPPIGFYTIMRNMGAESSLYENYEFSVSEEIKEKNRQMYESMENRIEDLLTIEQMYRGVLEL